MANSSREIRRRIKSVKNISQITKAMELVAASKMRKAQAQTLSSRPYAKLSSDLISRLARRADLLRNPLINRVLPDDQKLPVQKVLAVVVSSDRGLAGSFNTNLINKALEFLQKESKEKLEVITIGKKAFDAMRKFGYNAVAAFASKDKNISVLDASPIAKIVIDDYLAFKYEKAMIIYTDFISTLVQNATILQLLPFAQAPLDKDGEDNEYLFEPDPEKLLEKLVADTVEFQIYQILLESAASEHSARMVAMKNANDAAGDLIDDLTLTYNQARQAGITKELSEISAAKLAMEK